MRAVIQRVAHASVTIGGVVKSRIGQGCLVLLGCENADTQDDIEWLAKKIAALRIFDDDQGVMNRSVTDVGGEILVVSQFTLWASYKKGNRPSYLRAGSHEVTVPLYEKFVAAMAVQLSAHISIHAVRVVRWEKVCSRCTVQRGAECVEHSRNERNEALYGAEAVVELALSASAGDGKVELERPVLPVLGHLY